jgi:hypothetical protein
MWTTITLMTATDIARAVLILGVLTLLAVLAHDVLTLARAFHRRGLARVHAWEARQTRPTAPARTPLPTRAPSTDGVVIAFPQPNCQRLPRVGVTRRIG